MSETKMITTDADALLERLNAGGGEEQEAAARIAGLEARPVELSNALPPGVIESLFTAGVNQCMNEGSTECEYAHGTLARHWWTRGHAYQARAFRGVELAGKVKELQAQLAEANARIKQWEAQAKRADIALADLEQERDEAEAERDKLRTALEEIAEGRFYCGDGDCRAIDTAQAALAAAPERPVVQAPAIIKTLTNQHKQIFAVYLSDGQKIGIERDGMAAWLRIEPTSIVRTATPKPPQTVEEKIAALERLEESEVKE